MSTSAVLITLFPRTMKCLFFIQGGLGPPEFRRAFLTGKKVPPWKKISAPLNKIKRPPEGKTAPPWKVQSTRKFTAAHQKCYMGHSVTGRETRSADLIGFGAAWILPWIPFPLQPPNILPLKHQILSAKFVSANSCSIFSINQSICQGLSDKGLEVIVNETTCEIVLCKILQFSALAKDEPWDGLCSWWVELISPSLPCPPGFPPNRLLTDQPTPRGGGKSEIPPWEIQIPPPRTNLNSSGAGNLTLLVVGEIEKWVAEGVAWSVSGW